MGIVPRATPCRASFTALLLLFIVLVVLIGAVSFVPATDQGRLVLSGVTMFLLIATVEPVGARRCRSPSRCYSPSRGGVPVISVYGTTVTKTWQLRGCSVAALLFITTTYLLRYVSSQGS